MKEGKRYVPYQTVSEMTTSDVRTIAIYHFDGDKIAVILIDDSDTTFSFRVMPASLATAMIDWIKPHNIVCGTHDRTQIEALLPPSTVFVAVQALPEGTSPIRVACKVMDAFRSYKRVHMVHKVHSKEFPFEEWMMWINWPAETTAVDDHSTTSPFSSSVCTS